MKLYLAGPMTGYEDFNYPTFNAVASWLRDPNGYEVFSPAEIDAGGGILEGSEVQPWKYYMRKAIQLLLQAEGIAMLPGWEKSKGARREFDIALDLEYKIFTVKILPFADGPYYSLEQLCR
jgi:hypothetical protein